MGAQLEAALNETVRAALRRQNVDKPDTECWLCEKPRADEWSVYCEEHMDGGTFCLGPICMPGQCVCNGGRRWRMKTGWTGRHYEAGNHRARRTEAQGGYGAKTGV